MGDMEEPNFAAKTVIAGCFFILGSVGIIANILVLTTFLKRRSQSYFHIQLALANSLYLGCIALSGPSALSGRWLFGDTWCQLYGVHAFVGGNLNFAFVSAICIEAYIAVCHKQSYKQLPGSGYFIMSVLIWAYSLGFGFAPFFGWSSYSLESNGGSSCGLNLEVMDDIHFSYLVPAIFGLATQLVIAAAAVLSANRSCREDQKQLAPLLNDREVVKVATACLTAAVLGSGLYTYRILQAMAHRPSHLSFVGVELSHILLKAVPATCPLFYYLYGQGFTLKTSKTQSKKTAAKKRS